jgi:hypothetical protein
MLTVSGGTGQGGIAARKDGRPRTLAFLQAPASAAALQRPAPWQTARASGKEDRGGNMRLKAIMVDVDGVLITHPDPGGWSANLENDLGIPPALLHDRFFAATG